MDQRGGDAGPRSVEDLFQQRVQQRLTLYGANPSENARQEAIRDIQLQDERQQKERKRQEREREQQQRERERQQRERERQRELEFAYKQLLDSAQQQGDVPFAWDYQEIPVDNAEILAEESSMWQGNSVLCQPAPAAMDQEVLWQMQKVPTDLDDPVSAWDDPEGRNVPVQQYGSESAVENPEIAIPKAEVLTAGPSSANLCSAPMASSGFHGQEMVNPYPHTPVAETGDLIDFSAEEEHPEEPPAEELGSGTNFTVLCPAPRAVFGELQGTSPAEALVTGQRVQDLCSTPVAVPEAQGEKVAITPQPQITEGMDCSEYATGGCTPLQLERISVDGTSVSTGIPHKWWPVGPDPQQHDGLSPATLSSLQRLKGLQGEGPIQAPPQRQTCSLREAEDGGVQTTLLPSPELTQWAQKKSQYTDCLCAEESKTFEWNMKATKLGSVNVKVRTEAINSLELCQNEIPVVPSHGSSNTITKPLLVQNAVFQTKGGN